MLDKQATELAPLPSRGFYSRMFVVPKLSGGWRPIIDLSPLNRYVQREPFTMESPRTVLQSLREGDWLTSIDLKDAYFHVPIHPSSRRYLRFVWDGQVYQFRALCFGLSSAPFIFTRVLQPISVWAHRHHIRLTRYLDDWLIAAPHPDLASQHTLQILQLCGRLGLLVNESKSDLVPSQHAVYLGMDIDTSLFLVRPTDARLRRFAGILSSFCLGADLPARLFLRLLGHMVSLEKIVPGARIRIRSLQFHLRALWLDRNDLSCLIPVSSDIWPDLQWWSCPVHLLQGTPIHQLEPDVLLFTDASSHGWGAHLMELQASGIWDRDEAMRHINWLELQAVWLGLLAFHERVAGSAVRIMSDNSTVVGYIRNQGGTRSRSLCDLACHILLWAESHQVSLSARHIPGSLNTMADALSRRSPVSTNWSLSEAVCARIWRTWGRPHVDLFATRDNTRLPLFVSPFPDPEAWAVDAFSVTWSDLWSYAFPPFTLLPLLLRKVRRDRAELVLVAPNWPARPWFPELLELLSDLPRSLPTSPRLLRQGRRFHARPDLLHLHAWRLSGDPSATQAFRDALPVAWHALSSQPPLPSTSPSGPSSCVGVVDGRSILALPLSR